MFIKRLAFDWVTRCYFRERFIDGTRNKMAAAWSCLYVETQQKVKPQYQSNIIVTAVLVG